MRKGSTPVRRSSPTRRSDAAHASHATQGWVKIVAEDSTGRFLGVHAAGE